MKAWKILVLTSSSTRRIKVISFERKVEADIAFAKIKASAYLEVIKLYEG